MKVLVDLLEKVVLNLNCSSKPPGYLLKTDLIGMQPGIFQSSQGGASGSLQEGTTEIVSFPFPCPRLLWHRMQHYGWT